MKSYARFDTLEQIYGMPEGLAAGGDRVVTLNCATPRGNLPPPKGAPEPAVPPKAKGSRARKKVDGIPDFLVRQDADGKAPPAPATKLPTPASNKPAGKPATKPTKAKKPAGRKTAYDWEKAEAGAKAGTLPPMPPFVSYRPHIADALKLAKAGDAKGLGEYVADFKGYGKWKANAETDAVPASRVNLFRFAHLCLSALRAKARR